MGSKIPRISNSRIQLVNTRFHNLRQKRARRVVIRTNGGDANTISSRSQVASRVLSNRVVNSFNNGISIFTETADRLTRFFVGTRCTITEFSATFDGFTLILINIPANFSSWKQANGGIFTLISVGCFRDDFTVGRVVAIHANRCICVAVLFQQRIIVFTNQIGSCGFLAQHVPVRTKLGGTSLPLIKALKRPIATKRTQAIDIITDWAKLIGRRVQRISLKS
mmetsp:Transcript_35667/g.55678  ORF Transcript_35667/g.55678 Transcript_35667/m.55678 type:complete len:223 (-) Transcript_35667:2812-3480(-)